MGVIKVKLMLFWGQFGADPDPKLSFFVQYIKMYILQTHIENYSQ
jgi:hypothetical protein